MFARACFHDCKQPPGGGSKYAKPHSARSVHYGSGMKTSATKPVKTADYKVRYVVDGKIKRITLAIPEGATIRAIRALLRGATGSSLIDDLTRA